MRFATRFFLVTVSTWFAMVLVLVVSYLSGNISSQNLFAAVSLLVSVWLIGYAWGYGQDTPQKATENSADIIVGRLAHQHLAALTCVG